MLLLGPSVLDPALTDDDDVPVSAYITPEDILNSRIIVFYIKGHWYFFYCLPWIGFSGRDDQNEALLLSVTTRCSHSYQIPVRQAIYFLLTLDKKAYRLLLSVKRVQFKIIDYINIF